MANYKQIFFIHFSHLFLFSTKFTVSHPLCEYSLNIERIYNIGSNLAIQQSPDKIWLYVKESHKLTDQSLTLSQIYGENKFRSVESTFSFNFNDCTTEDDYCKNTKMMQNIVIVLGKRSSDSEEQEYLSYRLVDGNLKTTNDDELNSKWGIKSGGMLKGMFWIPSLSPLTYSSTAFYLKENTLYANIKANDEEEYRVITRKMDEKGLWNNIWKSGPKSEFVGIFTMNYIIYFVAKNETIYTIEWKKYNATHQTHQFHRSSKLREFINCYQNSSLNTNDNTVTVGKRNFESETVKPIERSFQKKSEDESNDNSKIWLLIPALIIIVLIAGGCFFALYFKKSKSKDPDQDIEDVSNHSDVPNDNPNDHSSELDQTNDGNQEEGNEESSDDNKVSEAIILNNEPTDEGLERGSDENGVEADIKPNEQSEHQ